MRDTPLKRKPVILIIMDGYGLRKANIGNAVNQAKKPHLDAFMHDYPMTTLAASGEEVGLPEGQMGNSEVGHLNMGAGRTVYQSLTLINKNLKDGTFFTNEHYVHAIKKAVETGHKLHVFGLLSDGGVHSHIRHILAMVKMAKMYGVGKDQLLFHCFLDGRDVGMQEAPRYLAALEEEIAKEGIGHIASVHGRYYVMDRDKNMDRVDKSYRVMTMREGNKFTDPIEYVKSQYASLPESGKEPSDEFVIPAYNENVDGTIVDGDSVIFMNFRPDRAIQISTVITNPYFYEHPALKDDGTPAYKAYVPAVALKDITYVCTMKYADSVKGEIAFVLPKLTNTLGEVLANRGFKQLRIAETEKYAHVTFFFDGTVNYDGVEKPELTGCRRVLINSPKVATYDLQPEMSAYLVRDALIKELDKGDLDVVILNFANCDMVGHTAVMPAVIKAVETVDECVGSILDWCDKNGGTILLTADHGNAEQCIDDNGQPMTKHTTAPVPFVVNDKSLKLRDGGALRDIAPTILDLLGTEKPEEMEGVSLITK